MGYTITEYHGTYNRTVRTATIKYIVVHYTGSGSSASGNALANCKYFAGGNRNASAHYFIDDASIYEYLDPSEYAAWHCGGGSGPVYNSNSIGIEVCASAYQTDPYTDEEISRLTWLTQKLMDEYSIPAANVVRHYDVTGKLCPYNYIKGSGSWDDLWATITGTSTTTSSTTSSTTSTTTTASLDVDGYWGPATTKAMQTFLGTTVDGIVSTQSNVWKSSNPGLLSTSWEWVSPSKAASSPMVKAMQKRIGNCTADGLIGQETIKALQTYVGTTVDGCIDYPSPCVKAVQKRLNAGTF